MVTVRTISLRKEREGIKFEEDEFKVFDKEEKKEKKVKKGKKKKGGFFGKGRGFTEKPKLRKPVSEATRRAALRKLAMALERREEEMILRQRPLFFKNGVRDRRQLFFK